MLQNFVPLAVAMLLNAAWGIAPASAEATGPVTLHYILRPPYMMPTADGGLEGLTGEPSYLAFKKANVPVVLAETPFARQMYMLENNTGQDCMIGMFKKPERELFAKFTKPVYQDQAQLILTAAANAERLAKFNSVSELFADKSLLLLVKLRYSYGVALDALMERYQPRVNKTADENLMMIKSIKLKMADYMFMAPEEASVAIHAAGFEDADFRLIKLKTMPDGEARHLMCSKNVPDEVINKLNAVIRLDKRRARP